MAIDLLSIGRQTAGASNAAATAVSAATGASTAGFGDALSKLLNAVESSTGDANTAVTNMVSGSGDVHEAMIALQRAEMTLELTVQIRNKLVAAYQDVMRMPI